MFNNARKTNLPITKSFRTSFNFNTGKTYEHERTKTNQNELSCRLSMFVTIFLYAIYIKIDAVYITFQRSFSYDKMWYFVADCMEKSFYLCFHFITFSTMNEKQDIKCATIILYEKHAAILHINAKSYFILTCKSGCKKSFCNIAWRDNACRLTNLIEMSLAKCVC